MLPGRRSWTLQNPGPAGAKKRRKVKFSRTNRQVNRTRKRIQPSENKELHGKIPYTPPGGIYEPEINTTGAPIPNAIALIQSQGPIADAKLYATMNHESNRMKEDSRVDERTLQEIYLLPFTAAIREAHVGTVMCAYRRSMESIPASFPMPRGRRFRARPSPLAEWLAALDRMLAAAGGLDGTKESSGEVVGAFPGPSRALG